jgi:hypothetical protein
LEVELIAEIANFKLHEWEDLKRGDIWVARQLALYEKRHEEKWQKKNAIATAENEESEEPEEDIQQKE